MIRCVTYLSVAGDHGVDKEGIGFGTLLRARRRAAGLTQAELASRAGVGVRTVRDLERGRASRPQRTTVHLLARALGLTSAERSAFAATVRGRHDTGFATLALALPPGGPLIGRDGDVADIADQVVEPGGPVSLTGVAGSGKTGLAMAVAHQLIDRLPGGVAGVPVTDGATEADLLATIASVFGVRRAENLPARLAAAPALLLLDAADRAPATVAGVLRWLLPATPLLRVLSTGRHPLEVTGERVWPVPPLPVPPPDTSMDLEAVRRYPAAALFLARLRQVRRSPLTSDEVAALVILVRRLGGLPLALEMAAACGRLLDLNQILRRYGDRVLDLAGVRDGRGAVVTTLRDAVAASYRLLEPAERRVLRTLSVFRNGWSVEMAEALLVAGDPAGGGPFASDPVPLLDRLLALGMVTVWGPGRFRLLDVVRDFAGEQAAIAGELAAAKRRHAVVFAALAARVAPRLAGPEPQPAAAQLDEVASDLWAALTHAANYDPLTALRLASNLPRWWRLHGNERAGRLWLRRLLNDPRTRGHPADRGSPGLSYRA